MENRNEKKSIKSRQKSEIDAKNIIAKMVSFFIISANKSL